MSATRLFGLAALSLMVTVPETAAQDATPLRRGVAVRATLAAGDTARYALDLGDSTFVLGALQQGDAPLVVRLVTAGGEQRLRAQGPGTGELRFAGLAVAAGRYVLQVLAPSGKATSFSMTLLRQEPVAKDPSRRADQMLARYDAPGMPGGEVRVWRNGRVLYTKGFGTADLRHGLPYRPDTPTNIGSTSKQFTAFAVLLLAERGQLSLDDDIRKHFPELPVRDDTVRVRHLLTHTSGLREFLNLLLMTDRQVGQDMIERRELIEIIQRQPRLQNVPGAEFNYNNTAFGLAAMLVERRSGKDFPTFLRDEVFRPLGMTRTMSRTDRTTVVPNGAPGYQPTPEGFKEAIDLAAAVGAGGIYTTVEDLQRWGENMLAPNPKVGSRAIFDTMMANTTLSDGKKSGYGMGLFTDEQRGLARVQHGGADVAHRSMLALYPSINAGVSVQSNNATFSSDVAFEIASAFFNDAMTSSAAASGGAAPSGQAYDPASMTAARFRALEGRYALTAAPAFVLRFFREGTTFYTQATGQPRVAMVPTSDSTFKLTGVEAVVRFERDAEGKWTKLTLLQNGQQPATRLPDAPAFAPTGDALRAFAGHYYSDELDSFMTLEVRNDSLFLQQRRQEEARMVPGNEVDRFSARGLGFAFERDRNGVVTGFYVDAGRTRDVRFARVRPQ